FEVEMQDSLRAPREESWDNGRAHAPNAHSTTRAGVVPTGGPTAAQANLGDQLSHVAEVWPRTVGLLERSTLTVRAREGRIFCGSARAMSASSDCVAETVWKAGDIVLCRGVPNDRWLPPLLTLASASTQPLPATVARLEHAYSLRDQLDADWAARPRSLVDDH